MMAVVVAAAGAASTIATTGESVAAQQLNLAMDVKEENDELHEQAQARLAARQYIYFLQRNNLGQISNLWVAYADRFGVEHPDTFELARLANVAVCTHSLYIHECLLRLHSGSMSGCSCDGSAAKPGASVMTTTVGALRSGKMSTWAEGRRAAAAAKRTPARTRTRAAWSTENRIRFFSTA